MVLILCLSESVFQLFNAFYGLEEIIEFFGVEFAFIIDADHYEVSKFVAVEYELPCYGVIPCRKSSGNAEIFFL